jgi:hypothetical protein
MVRVLTEVALGSPDGPARRSTTSVLIPYCAKVIAVLSPAGPAPTTSTVGESDISPPSSDVL